MGGGVGSMYQALVLSCPRQVLRELFANNTTLAIYDLSGAPYVFLKKKRTLMKVIEGAVVWKNGVFARLQDSYERFMKIETMKSLNMI